MSDESGAICILKLRCQDIDLQINTSFLGGGEMKSNTSSNCENIM